MALLDVRNLVKWYGPRKVVDGVSFHVHAGEVVGLLGPNGAGKTTSFRMTTGQVPPNDGEVHFAEVDITSKAMYQRARLGMGYLSQEPSIFRKLTVEQNLLAILEALPRSRTLGRKLTRSERIDRTDEALARFKLDHIRKNPAARCSGGEKRRLEIARCLVCEPLLILLDEPFAAVDPITKEDLRSNIRALADQGIGILLTDHDVREVLKITDRSYLIQDGKVVCHGTPEEIKRDPVAIRGYLGSTFAEEVQATPLRVIQNPTSEVRSGTSEVIVPPSEDVASTHFRSVKAHFGNVAPGRVAALDAESVVDLVPVIAEAAPPPAMSTQTPAPAGLFSASTQALLNQEKLRKLIDNLGDPAAMPATVAELAHRGPEALPVLVDALERREAAVRHVAHRLLEQIMGETLAFDAAATDDVRLRQAAHIRVRIKQRAA
jgi:lipopolysaccharide export system ATP-binding protein